VVLVAYGLGVGMDILDHGVSLCYAHDYCGFYP